MEQMQEASRGRNEQNVLVTAQVDTPLGPMLLIADEDRLYLAEFVREGLEHKIERLRRKTGATLTSGYTEPIRLIKRELERYFAGELKKYTTPLSLQGTLFQRRVWEELQNIPFGETRSYSDIATAIGRPTAFRAAAQANGANPLAVIVPCHRVINTNGNLGGYAGGLDRKKWLIHHEKR